MGWPVLRQSDGQGGRASGAPRPWLAARANEPQEGDRNEDQVVAARQAGDTEEQTGCQPGALQARGICPEQ
jgi:hypothetical protein